MGLPEIIVAFKTAASTAVQRSGHGIVALILKDESNETVSYSYTKESQVADGHWTEANRDYIKKTFLGSPGRVLIERIGAEEDYAAALGRLKNKSWNYLAIPDLGDGEQKTIADWVIVQRKSGKTFKAVLPSYTADNEGIINFATENIQVGAKVYTTAQYCCRIAGILAGTALDNSCTYAVLAEVDTITESTDADADVDAGKLILINDGQRIKIGRGVNSLTTVEAPKKEDWKKIKIIDGMDLVQDDIRTTWTENYVGMGGKYDHKILFISAINVYLKSIASEGVLDDENENLASINIEAQRAFLEKLDVAYAEKSDEEIKKANTGSKVFVQANVKFCDAMEDLDFTIYM